MQPLDLMAAMAHLLQNNQSLHLLLTTLDGKMRSWRLLMLLKTEQQNLRKLSTGIAPPLPADMQHP